MKDYNKKKIGLITGITGQCGSYLAELLLNKGYEVHGVMRRSSSFNTHRIEHIYNHKNLKLHFGDMTDAFSLDNLIIELQPDELYHLAAQSHVHVSFALPKYTAEVDAIGTLNLLEAIRKHSPKTHFYNACTSELFGKAQETPQRETTPFYPRSPYACFPEKTKILVKRKKNHRYGKIEILSSDSIENIKIGDQVLSFNEKTHKKEYSTVIDTMNRFDDKIYHIKFSNGNSIKCTKEHPFYTSNKKWVEAKDLKIEDECIQYIYSGLNQRITNLSKSGKTYEEFYGKNKAAKIKERKKKNAHKGGCNYIYNKEKKVYKKGKSFVELYGEERALLISKKSSKSQKGIKKPGVSIAKKGKPSWNRNIKWEDIYTKEKITKKQKTQFGENSSSKRIYVKKKISNSVKKLWKDVNYHQKQIQARQKKNKLEILAESFINNIIPNEFEYNGRLEKKIKIDGKIPDFVNVNNKNKVIEIFGTYWHSLPGKMSEKELKNHYKKNGYNCLVIWDTEFKDEIKLKEKIQNFYFNPSTEIVKITDIQIIKEKEKVYNITVKNNHNYFAYGLLVHNCAKLYSYWISKNYREAYNIFIANGILFNHESERRGHTFVTRKITLGLANLANNYQLIHDKKQVIPALTLGNLYSKRDWGYAPDYVEGMWRMLQQEKGEDFILSTGETHSIKEFINECITYTPFLGKTKWIGKELDEKLMYSNIELIAINPKYYRPTEVDLLVGDNFKAEFELGWTPTTTFKELVRKMMKHDLDNVSKS